MAFTAHKKVSLHNKYSSPGAIHPAAWSPYRQSLDKRGWGGSVFTVILLTVFIITQILCHIPCSYICDVIAGPLLKHWLSLITLRHCCSLCVPMVTMCGVSFPQNRGGCDHEVAGLPSPQVRQIFHIPKEAL